MVGSMALSIPYAKYTGHLLFDNKVDNVRSNHYSVAYLTDYLNFLKSTSLNTILNLNEFTTDIEHGFIFETNIPISYGLGSSGAIVASIYNAYAKNPTNELQKLKMIFSEMESYYHGKSSGLDPLVSYLNRAILIDNNSELKLVDLPEKRNSNNGGIFLIDTKTVGETQPLVSRFINECKNNSYKGKIQDILIPLNNNSISNFLNSNFTALLQDVKLISQFTLENFKPMIPSTIKDIWEKGLDTDSYYLKLCGSGGGGMMLGFTKNLDNTLKELKDFDMHIL